MPCRNLTTCADPHLLVEASAHDCEYEAADVASVRNVQREANARFERVWAADVLGDP
jgi:hypothetical protein